MHRLAVPLLLVASLSAAERFNHAGRLLGAPLTVATPTLFNTAQADAVLATMQVMPRDNPWNEDITGLPVLANSAAILATITNDLVAANRPLRAFHEMNFVLIPDGQAAVPITFVDYPDESEPSPYPIPVNQPIEGWPRETGTQTLVEWQQATGGDRHGIMVKPQAGLLWETWQMRSVAGAWQASNGARFALGSNALRTDGWTSGDAAGLPMFPALVRYDEVQRGAIEHALRFIVKHTRAAYLYPATHHASNPSTTNVDVPAMGQRLRLKPGFTIPGTWSAESRAVATALKRYGGLVADNGNFFSCSVTPDHRWPADCFDDLRTLLPGDFEIVASTGPTGGPRAAGAPTSDAGPDQSAAVGSLVALNGSATGSGITTQWSVLPGAPGSVTFGNANAAATTVTGSAAGTYQLRLAVSDGTHVTAYDGVMLTITAPGGGATTGTTQSGGSGSSGGCGAGALTALLGLAWLSGRGTRAPRSLPAP